MCDSAVGSPPSAAWNRHTLGDDPGSLFDVTWWGYLRAQRAPRGAATIQIEIPWEEEGEVRMARYVNVGKTAFGAALLVLVLAVPVFAAQPCRSFRIDTDPDRPETKLDELYDNSIPPNLIGGHGPVQAQIGEETFDAELTLLRLGPFTDKSGDVLDFFTLDAGRGSTLEASLNGVAIVPSFIPPIDLIGKFDGTGRVESGKRRLARDAGVFHIELRHDFSSSVTPRLHVISVHVNGKLCDER